MTTLEIIKVRLFDENETTDLLRVLNATGNRSPADGTERIPVRLYRSQDTLCHWTIHLFHRKGDVYLEMSALARLMLSELKCLGWVRYSVWVALSSDA
jgi:hypothetical protein